MHTPVLRRIARTRIASTFAAVTLSAVIALTPNLAQARLDVPTGAPMSQLNPGEIAKVTGGGTVLAAPTYPTTIASFGLNARRPPGFTGSTAVGRLNYDRHRNSTGRHVNAPIVFMSALVSTTPTPKGTGGSAGVVADCTAIGATCPPGNLSAVAYVEDNSDSGAGSDIFKIFFCSSSPAPLPDTFNGTSLPGCEGPEGGALRTGNIQVRGLMGEVGETISTAGAAGVFPTTPSFNGVELAGGIYGIGVRNGTGTVFGDLHVEYTGISTIGLYQIISIDAWITGVTDVGGTQTLTGTCTLDMGDGPPPTGGLSFTGTLTATGIAVTVGPNSIPTLPKTDGFTVME